MKYTCQKYSSRINNPTKLIYTYIIRKEIYQAKLIEYKLNSKSVSPKPLEWKLQRNQFLHENNGGDMSVR